MRDISISRAKPATRLTRVSPPMVPVALNRFIARLGPGARSRFRAGVRKCLAAAGAVAVGTLRLLGLELLHIGRTEVDRVEQQRREAGVGHGVGDDLPGEGKGQAR